eukprot:Tbor_TRINITY_DN6045_c2_g2::TRINITY_DN6045_c2_g2_i3::g.11442::m.11442
MTTNNNNNNIIKYSIIVPAYKESGNIEQLVRRVFKALENNGYKRGTVEMIIIDDNSNDGSVDIVNKLRMEDPSENNNNNLNNNNNNIQHIREGSTRSCTSRNNRHNNNNRCLSEAHNNNNNNNY